MLCKNKRNLFRSHLRTVTVRVEASKATVPLSKSRSIWPLRIISSVGRRCNRGGSISATASHSVSAMSSSCVEKKLHFPSSCASRRSSVHNS